MTQTHINIAMLAHVDAGKTTLSEALLYKSGSIRKAGRVDNKDAFLDTNEMERNRGITISTSSVSGCPSNRSTGSCVSGSIFSTSCFSRIGAGAIIWIAFSPRRTCRLNFFCHA